MAVTQIPHFKRPLRFHWASVRTALSTDDYPGDISYVYIADGPQKRLYGEESSRDRRVLEVLNPGHRFVVLNGDAAPDMPWNKVRPVSTAQVIPHEGASLRDYLKTEVATNDDTIREHSSVAASPSSSLPSSHTSPANLDTSRASPMFVRPPSDAPDSVSVLTRRASPLLSAGYAADSRIWRPSRGQWGCHIPYPDTDAEDSALLDEVAQPPLTPVSPPTAWHRGRSLPPPLCSVGHHLHLREYCAWFPASLGRSDCDRLHPPQTGFAH